MGKRGAGGGRRGVWGARIRLLALFQAAARRFAPPAGGHLPGRGGQAKERHVAVDGLVVPRLDDIRLVPDADAAVLVADRSAEAAPGAPVRVVRTARKAF